MTTENQDLLRRAAFEIRDLRNRNQRMQDRLQMFDDVMSLLNASKPSNSQGFSPDVVYEIEKELSKPPETL